MLNCYCSWYTIISRLDEAYQALVQLSQARESCIPTVFCQIRINNFNYIVITTHIIICSKLIYKVRWVFEKNPFKPSYSVMWSGVQTPNFVAMVASLNYHAPNKTLNEPSKPITAKDVSLIMFFRVLIRWWSFLCWRTVQEKWKIIALATPFNNSPTNDDARCFSL